MSDRNTASHILKLRHEERFWYFLFSTLTQPTRRTCIRVLSCDKQCPSSKIDRAAACGDIESCWNPSETRLERPRCRKRSESFPESFRIRQFVCPSFLAHLSLSTSTFLSRFWLFHFLSIFH